MKVDAMTSCGEILTVGILLQAMSVKGWVDSIFPENLTAAILDDCVGFSPQHPSPKRRGAGGEFKI